MSWQLGPITTGSTNPLPEAGIPDEMAALRWSVEQFEFEVEAFKISVGSASQWPPAESTPDHVVRPPDRGQSAHR